MRAFFAVDLHHTLGEAAHGWGRAVAHALGPRGASDLSWVPATRMHVTLHFLGAVEPAALETLLASLGGRVPEPPFEVTLGAGGTFPATGRPRVLWLSLGGGADPLRRVHAWLQPRVAGIGQPDRHDSYAPHLTIARVRRDTMPGLGHALRDAAARTPVPRGAARVAGVTVMESVPSPKGPIYRPVAVLPLDPDTPSSG
jgi:2'-5' RNA ligase